MRRPVLRTRNRRIPSLLRRISHRYNFIKKLLGESRSELESLLREVENPKDLDLSSVPDTVKKMIKEIELCMSHISSIRVKIVEEEEGDMEGERGMGGEKKNEK